MTACPSDAPVYLLERVAARRAAAALRLAIADPSTMGPPNSLHIDYSRPRRSAWITTWPGLPGFTRTATFAARSNSAITTYTHELLPGWEYAKGETLSEMIPDLEALAERGVRPTEATLRKL